MFEYKTKVKLIYDRCISLRELSVLEYKDLQKILLEDDLDTFIVYFKEFVSSLIDYDGVIYDFDYLIIAFYIKLINNTDEMYFYSYPDGKKCKLTVNLNKLIKNILELYKIDNCYKINMGNLKEVYFIPDKSKVFYFKDGKNNIINIDLDEFVPSMVKDINNKFKEYIDKFRIELFTIYNENGHRVNVKLDHSATFIYNFIKSLLKEDLSGVYEEIYLLNQNLKLSFDDLSKITNSEKMVYIKIHHEKEKEEEKQNQQKNQLPLGMGGGK